MKHESFIADTRMLICALGALTLLASNAGALAQTPAVPTAPTDKSGSKGNAASTTRDSATQGMPGQGGSRDLWASMMGMVKRMEFMKMSGDPDGDFAMIMKRHCQGVIDMAQMQLKGGSDSKMRAMATRIIEAEQKEMKEFDQWLEKRN